MSPHHVCLLLFALLLVEGIGIPGVPFQPLFLAAGYFIQEGKIGLLPIVVMGALGNLLGNMIGYWIGAMTVPSLMKKFQGGEDTAFSWFNKYGPAVVVISRWFGPIRTPTIVCAATMGMPPGIYLFYSALGAFSWTFVWQFLSWKGIGLLTIFWDYYHMYATWWMKILLVLMFIGMTAFCLYFFVFKKKHTSV
jgi:membrane protein DedA with SNARE-associated domain